MAQSCLFHLVGRVRIRPHLLGTRGAVPFPGISAGEAGARRGRVQGAPRPGGAGLMDLFPGRGTRTAAAVKIPPGASHDQFAGVPVAPAAFRAVVPPAVREAAPVAGDQALPVTDPAGPIGFDEFNVSHVGLGR